MRRYLFGAVLTLALSALAVVAITMRAGEMPRMVNVWPLFVVV